MNKKTTIVLIIITVILLGLFAFLLINNPQTPSEDKQTIYFEGSTINVFFDDKELSTKGSINEKNEIIINMSEISGENKEFTLKEIEKKNYIVISKEYLNNINVYVYSVKKAEEIAGAENTKENLNIKIEQNLAPSDIENTLDPTITGVSYKDTTKLANLIQGPSSMPDTYFFPLQYAPYGTNMVNDDLKYNTKILPSENLKNLAETYKNITNEDVIWDEDDKGFQIKLNTVEGAYVHINEQSEKVSVSTAHLRHNFTHICEKFENQTYCGYYLNNLLEDAHGKTLLLGMTYFGGKEFSERVFSLIDFYYMFSTENDKPITKELVEKYDLTFIKEEASARYNGEVKELRDLYVSYNDITWKITYDVGTRSTLSVGVAIEIPLTIGE